MSVRGVELGRVDLLHGSVRSQDENDARVLHVVRARRQDSGIRRESLWAVHAYELFRAPSTIFPSVLGRAGLLKLEGQTNSFDVSDFATEEFRSTLSEWKARSRVELEACGGLQSRSVVRRGNRTFLFDDASEFANPATPNCSCAELSPL